MFIDAIIVKELDGQVANRPVYAAIRVTLEGEKDILGLRAGSGREGAKLWLAVLTDMRNRGTKDVFYRHCDGLRDCRGGGERMATGDAANLYHSPHQGFLPSLISK